MGGTAPWHTGELLGFDLETTGVDRLGDVPVSFALVTVVGGRVVERRSALVDPGREVPEEAAAVHGITTERARCEGIPLPDALSEVTAALVDRSRRGVPVVGMKLDFDLTIVDVQAERHLDGGLRSRGWSGPVLDGLVLDRHLDRFRPGRRTLVDLCDHYAVTITKAHDAAADAEAAVAVVLALCRRYPVLSRMTLEDLWRRQPGWHRQWAMSYDSWRRQQQLAPLDEDEFDWPLPASPAAA